MSIRRLAILAVLLSAWLANATSKGTIQIKVLNSETHSVDLGGNGVPKNCDGVNFDAYCNNSKTSLLTSTLLVQAGSTPPFQVSCTIDSRWSKCTPLQKGESFDARKEKRGLVIYYVDDKGKARSELYTYLKGETPPDLSAAGGATSPASAASGAAMESANPTSAPMPARSAATAPAGSSGSSAEGTTVAAGRGETVKCSFASTPPGAEVTVDGRFVGSTPSVLGLATGTHVIAVSMDGYAQWKRELAVTAGSELTVNAVLEKAH
jgi:hypothetical protein